MGVCRMSARSLRPLVVLLLVLVALPWVAASAAGPRPAAPVPVAEPPAVGLVTLTLAPTTTVESVAPAPGTEPAPNLSATRARERSLAHTHRDATEYVVEVLDGAGRVTYRTTVGVERRLRSEHPGERTMFRDPRQVASVAIPLRHADGIRVLSPERGSLRATPAVDLPPAGAAGDVSLVPLPGYSLDPPANRLNVVILGDGYTAAQAADFARDAKELADGVLAMSPYADYTDFVNVVGAFGPSAQSGADHPPYQAGCTAAPQMCCPEVGAPAVGSYVDTRYDSTYCWAGIQRLLVSGDLAQVQADASAVYPQWNQLLVVVNDLEYGGSGGSIAVASRHPVGVATMQHELGHSLLTLMDEYYGPNDHPPATCSDQAGSSLPQCGPNITDLTSRADVKWRRWIDDSTPVPTPSPQVPDLVGVFRGGNYDATRYYRACDMCMMNAQGTEFGPVESEQMPVQLYRRGIRLVEPGSATPAPATPLNAGEPRTLRAEVLSPGAGPATRVRWLVDGTEVRSEVVSDGPVSFDWTPPDLATHQVTLEATDVAGILHPTLRALSRSQVTWQVGRAGTYGELLSNGGFESALRSGWPTHTTPDSFRTCKGGAHTGRCALRARLGSKQGYLLAQTVKPTLWPGDRLRLSGVFDSENLRAGVSVVATVTLQNGTTQRLTIARLPRDAGDRKGYLKRSASLVLPAAVKKIGVQVRLPRGSGAVWVDSLSLVATAP